MTLDTKTFAGFSSALVAIILGIFTAYLVLDRKVTALAATTLTSTTIEHIVDLKTASRLDEIIRRLARIEDTLDRLPKASVNATVNTRKETP